MRLYQLTPGAGPMYCGGCVRDNALVAGLRKLGHEVLMVPLYLPLTLDETDQSADTPIFFGGINVYLEQKAPLFRGAPSWLRDLLASRPLLQWAAGKTARTRAADLGELTLSMLRGELGNQAREIEELVAWLKTQPRPDLLCLSNALLMGMARRLKADLGAPVACALQGEDSFLDGLPETHRAACWRTLVERAAEVDLFIAPSAYYGNLMRERLGLPAERVRIVHNGISLDGYGEAIVRSPKSEVRSPATALSGGPNTQHPIPSIQHPASSIQQPASGIENHASRITHDAPPASSTLAVGFFARMCPEKGLDTLVDAYIFLRQRGGVGDVKLRVGGSCGPADEPFVSSLRGRLQANGLLADVEFHPNVDRAAKLDFLRSLSVFSVPARYGEAFGLYVLEAMAAGVPVVKPRAGAFPELIEATGGGVLCAVEDPRALAEAIEALLLEPARARALGEAGRRAVFERFSAETMARTMARVYGEVAGKQA